MHSRSRFAGSVLASAFAAVAAVAPALAPALAPSATPKPSPAPAPIGAGAVWKPPEGFRDRVTAVCGAAGGKFADCFVAQMKKDGASKEALEFTRRIGNQGYITAFVESGRVERRRRDTGKDLLGPRGRDAPGEDRRDGRSPCACAHRGDSSQFHLTPSTAERPHARHQNAAQEYTTERGQNGQI